MRLLTSASGAWHNSQDNLDKGDGIHGTAGMILKRTLLIALTFVTGGRKFITLGHRVIDQLAAHIAPQRRLRPPNCYSRQSRLPACLRGGRRLDRDTLRRARWRRYVDQLFARIEQKRPGSTLINLSVAGATTADAVNKQITQLDGTRATLVTICVGLNDLLRGREAKQFAENYETLVAKLKQPGRLIVVANLPDVASTPAMKGMADESLRLRLGQFNKAIEDIARRHGVPLVDLYKLSGEMIGSRPEFFSSDGLHPSDLGYAHWAEAIWPVIAQAIHE